MHSYPFHIGDYTTKTVHLTPLEDLAYRRLIDMYYDTEQPIPKPLQWVSRRLRLGCDEIESVLKEFFIEQPDCWKNDRCDAEIERYRSFIERQSYNGKRGGRKPKKPTANPPLTQALPTANPSLNQPITINHQPVNSNQEVIKKKEKRKSFNPPTFEEVSEYCKGRQFIDPVKFFDYYHPHWCDKDGNPVRNWKAKANTWAAKGKSRIMTRDFFGQALSKFSDVSESATTETIEQYEDTDETN